MNSSTVTLHVNVDDPRIDTYAKWLEDTLPNHLFYHGWRDLGQYGLYEFNFLEPEDLIAFKLKFGL